MKMTTAREVMTGQAEVARREMTIEDAAAKMAQLDVGALPICNTDGRLEGMITDRDVAVKVVAAGRDPRSTTVGDISQEDEVVTIGADDSIEEAIRTMKEHAVRRLPVIDGHKLVGMVSQADIARNLPTDKTGELVEAISAAP
jgi:CBS domain-containing protein